MIKKLLFKIILYKKYKQKLDMKNIKKVLIYRPDRIGDMILTFPLIQLIKKYYPNISIDIYASKSNSSLALNNPYISNVYIDDGVKILFKIRNNKYDILLDMYENRFSNTILRVKFIGAKFTFGLDKYRKKGLKDSDFKLYYKMYAKNKNQHVLDKNLEMLDVFDIDDKSFSNELFLENKYIVDMKQYIMGDKKNILFNIQGSSESRTISVTDLKEIIKNLSLRDKININIISLPSNYKIIENILKNINIKNIRLIKTKEIYEAIALVKLSDIIVSPDTSIIHIASLMNKKIVGIYSSDESNYRSFHPFSSEYKVVKSPHKQNQIEGFNIKELIGCIDEYCE